MCIRDRMPASGSGACGGAASEACAVCAAGAGRASLGGRVFFSCPVSYTPSEPAAAGPVLIFVVARLVKKQNIVGYTRGGTP